MAVMMRNGHPYIYFRPFRTKKIGLMLNVSKTEARQIETLILRACRSGCYSGLDASSREACIRMFENQQWELPPELAADRSPREELTLWKTVRMCLTYPAVANSPNRERHEQAFAHIVEKWGSDFPVKAIWIPKIKEYQVERLNERAAGSTVNKERAALSTMFQVLIEMGLVEHNPVRLVRGLSDKDGRREVYVGLKDFNALLSNHPTWGQPIVQTMYFTGMRRGEVLGLKWENVNPEARIIRLHAHQTKERKPKRIPIHQSLIPILESVRKVRSIGYDQVFLINGIRPPCEDSLRKPWKHAVTAAGLDPALTLKDLRHVWKTNAFRSGMDYEIRETIMGHATGIAGRYGRISDLDLIIAIDRMTFDHGETEICVSRRKKGSTVDVTGEEKKGKSKVTGTMSTKNQEAPCLKQRPDNTVI